MTKRLGLELGGGCVKFALFPGNVRKEEGESSLRLYHSVGGSYVLFKSLLHIGDSVTMLGQDPCLLGQIQGGLEPSSRWGLICRSCEWLGE